MYSLRLLLLLLHRVPLLTPAGAVITGGEVWTEVAAVDVALVVTVGGLLRLVAGRVGKKI